MFAEQIRLIRCEYDYEQREYRRATEQRGVAAMARRGDCWSSVQIGRAYYNALDRLVVEVERREDTGREHNFEYGRSVCFFDSDASGGLRYLDFACTVSYAETDRMVVTLPGEEALARLRALQRPAVQVHFDATTYRLMLDALRAVGEAKGDRLAHLRDVCHTATPAAFSAKPAVPVALPWLNASQQQAVGDVLRAKDVLIVHGPPGTGKTTTLVEAISEVLRREPQVLVCAQSNTAVDWISSLLADRGIEVLRIGNPTRVTDAMLSHTYERRFEAHADYPQLWQIRRTIRALYAQPRKSRSEGFHQKVARLRERADVLELQIRQALFDGCRVVACTLSGAANPVLTGHRFHTLFIDEAAQALEAACWIAMRRADRVIFAGDHCQLPPTVKSPEAMRGGLARTLMEQLAERKPEVVRLLTVQYRMCEALMQFPSQWFYGGRLTADASVHHRSILDDIDEPLVWVSSSEAAADEDERSEDRSGMSLINAGEAALTLRVLRAYAHRIGRDRLMQERIDFAVISPYRAQVSLLRRLISHDAYLRPLRRAITVNTVDAFQGQERDVVVISMVRANASGTIGFLSDLRRMNVAMTRARTKLIIIGDAPTLTRHRFYRELYARCRIVSEVIEPGGETG